MSSTLAVRPAGSADYTHFARLFPELHVDDPVPDPGRWMREMAPTTLLLQEDDGAVIAYAYIQALQEVGYVRHLVVQPDKRGQGIGRRMMCAVAEWLRAAGCARWCLNVKPDNTAALRLYASVGMRIAYASTSLRFDWDIIARLPQTDRELFDRPPEPSEDAAIEVAFDLPRGQIAHARSLPGRILLRLADVAAPERPLGFASFDPAFPGAFPFRVAGPELAAPLLRALAPHARPELAHMQVVVENDALLTRTLMEAGALVRLEILHMNGPIP